MLLAAALPHQAALVQGPAPSPSSSSSPAAAAAQWAPASAQQRHRRRRAALRAASSGGSGGLSYKDAGVDIDAGNELVKRIQKLNPNIGGFSGMVPFGALRRGRRCSVSCRRAIRLFACAHRPCSAADCMRTLARPQATRSWWRAPTAWAPSSSWRST